MSIHFFCSVRSSAEKEIVNNNPAAANNLTNQQLNLQQGELTPKSSPTINENQNHLIPTPPQAHPITVSNKKKYKSHNFSTLKYLIYLSSNICLSNKIYILKLFILIIYFILFSFSFRILK